MPEPTDTTAPSEPASVASKESRSQVPILFLYIALSRSEPHRTGQCAPFPPGSVLSLGRGEGDLREFPDFDEDRPGIPPRPWDGTRRLGGSSLSRTHARIHATATGLEVEALGRHPTYVNGVLVPEGRRVPLPVGQPLRLGKEVVLVAVWRLRVLPPLLYAKVEHPFGGPDKHGVVGESARRWLIRDAIQLASMRDDHTLVTGESGTGKEATCKAIHYGSKRCKGPLIIKNASVSTETLIESAYFGNVPNYPNPGTPASGGYVGDANGGTLVLDEVGSCPKKVQAGLLRVMNSGEYQTMGSTRTLHSDLRLIGATNEGDEGYRADFLARIERKIHLPALRDIPEDLGLLIQHFLLRLIAEQENPERLLQEWPSGAVYPRVSLRLVEYLLMQPLPGNARDLRALLKRAVEQSAEDTVEMIYEPPAASSAPPVSTPPAPSTARTSAEQAPPTRLGRPTREELTATLERLGSVNATALDYKVNRKVVERWMRELGIDKPSK
jgi:DNA-binding NtrC family response regulator